MFFFLNWWNIHNQLSTLVDLTQTNVFIYELSRLNFFWFNIVLRRLPFYVSFIDLWNRFFCYLWNYVIPNINFFKAFDVLQSNDRFLFARCHLVLIRFRKSLLIVFTIYRHEIVNAVILRLFFFLCGFKHYSPGMFVKLKKTQKIFTLHNENFWVMLCATKCWSVFPV